MKQPSAENVERAGELTGPQLMSIRPKEGMLPVGFAVIHVDSLSKAIAQALDEAERRGAAKELRRDGGFRNRLNKAFTGTVFGESQYEKGMSAGLTVAVTVCDDYANELERKPPQREGE